MLKFLNALFLLAGVVALGIALCVFASPAHAGGDDSPIVRRPRHAPVYVPPPVAPEIAVPPVQVAPPAIKVEDPQPKRIQYCDDTRYKVLVGRDDLYRTGCHWIPSFGQSGENPAQDDVSPN